MIARTRLSSFNFSNGPYAALPNYKLQSFNRRSSWPKESPTADIIHQPRQQTRQRALWLGTLRRERCRRYFTARAANAKSTQCDEHSKRHHSHDEGYSLAVYSLRGGLANRAARFGEQFWKTVPADYVIEVAPRDLVELLYPAPFRSSLLKHGPPRNVDPRFALAIIRQESRYQVDVKSVSAARGMMQFIPATANEIAAQLKTKGFYPGRFVLCRYRSAFGSQYLANLFQQFPNQPQAVAGSCNGGADNLARWIARSRANEADRYVPEIGFSQTKDYVYKVMANYWNYQRLYDAQLQPVN